MNELGFARPEAWPLLLLVPLLWYLLWRALRGRVLAARRYGAVGGERTASPLGSSLRLAAAAACLLVVWLEPRYGGERRQVERRGLDLVFALDTSRSMLARDMQPTRLEAAKRDIRSVLPDLQGGDRVALVAFAGEARLVVPLTNDLDAFGQLLEPVDTFAVELGGSDHGAAIRAALAAVAGSDPATTVIVLLTDGEDLGGTGQDAARRARDAGIPIHAVGYGSLVGSKIAVVDGARESFLTDGEGREVVSALGADTLRLTATITGGEFLPAGAMALPLRQLQRKRLQPMVQRAYDREEETVFKTRFQWALIPAMLLLAMELYWFGGSRR